MCRRLRKKRRKGKERNSERKQKTFSLSFPLHLFPNTLIHTHTYTHTHIHTRLLSHSPSLSSIIHISPSKTFLPSPFLPIVRVGHCFEDGDKEACGEFVCACVSLCVCLCAWRKRQKGGQQQLSRSPHAVVKGKAALWGLSHPQRRRHFAQRVTQRETKRIGERERGREGQEAGAVGKCTMVHSIRLAKLIQQRAPTWTAVVWYRTG